MIDNQRCPVFGETGCGDIKMPMVGMRNWVKFGVEGDDQAGREGVGT